MTQPAAWSVEEARGRLLFDQLCAEADAEIERYAWLPEVDPPVIPHVARTDTGTMRAVVVAI